MSPKHLRVVRCTPFGLAPVAGNEMKYEWSANYNGVDFASTGQLQRKR